MCGLVKAREKEVDEWAGRDGRMKGEEVKA